MRGIGRYLSQCGCICFPFQNRYARACEFGSDGVRKAGGSVRYRKYARDHS